MQTTKPLAYALRALSKLVAQTGVCSMTIQNIQGALANMGLKLSEDALVQRAREAVEAGDELDISIKVKRDRQGAVVSMSSTLVSQRESHGRLIRLE